MGKDRAARTPVQPPPVGRDIAKPERIGNPLATVTPVVRRSMWPHRRRFSQLEGGHWEVGLYATGAWSSRLSEKVNPR